MGCHGVRRDDGWNRQVTAIYAVWNQVGVALAADSNGTSRRDNQAWVDPVTKTYKLQNHQIAFAIAGSIAIDNVEIIELIKVWETTLPETHFSTTKDYIADFLAWYSRANLPDRQRTTKNFERYITEIFDFVKSDCFEEFTSGDLDQLSSKLYGNYSYVNSRLNIFGSKWNIFSRDLYEDDALEYESDFAIENIRELLNKKLEKKLNHEDSPLFTFRNSPYVETTLMFEAEKVFLETFGADFKSDNEAHILIREFAIDLIENLTLNAESTLLIVGYGESDWLPSGGTLEIGSTIMGVPTARVTSFGNSESLHYLSIGISLAVPQLAHGVSSEARQAFSNIASSLLDADDFQTMQTALDGSTEQTRDRLFGKLDQLTIERLEFVARLFVEIESLHSYLSEPVPGVGGDIRVITMTKTTSKEKHYAEIN